MIIEKVLETIITILGVAAIIDIRLIIKDCKELKEMQKQLDEMESGLDEVA